MTTYTSAFTGQVIQPTDVSYRSITLTTDTTLSWPVEVDTSGNYAARIMNVSASSASLSLLMPPANQTSVGTDALIRNTGANTFTVKDYAGGTIVSIASGEAKYIYITANSTAAGTWSTIAFGVGTSSPDASTLAGNGLLAIASTLNQAHPVTTIAATYTATASDRALSYVWNGGAGTINLPSAASVGDNWFFLLRNGGSGLLTVDPNGSDLINGEATLTMQPADSAIILCSGVGFYTIGLGQSTTFAFTQLTYPVVSGTYTLTPTQASNTIIKVTGTLSGSVDIVVPATVQVYYVLNATTGSVTFTTGVVGGLTTTISSGAQSILVCDSVNVLNANSAIVGALSLELVNGTASVPALRFNAEPSTGIYRSGAGELNVSVLGTKIGTFSSSGFTTTLISGGSI